MYEALTMWEALENKRSLLYKSLTILSNVHSAGHGTDEGELT
jgi:hypothetical protein